MELGGVSPANTHHSQPLE